MYGLTSKCDKFVADEDTNYETESNSTVCQGVYDLTSDVKTRTMQDFVDKCSPSWTILFSQSFMKALRRPLGVI